MPHAQTFCHAASHVTLVKAIKMSDCSEDDEVFMLASQQYEASINDLDAVQCQLPHAKPVTDGHNIDHRSSNADEDEEYVRQYLTDRELGQYTNMCAEENCINI